MNIDTVKDDLLSIADSGLKYATKKAPKAEIELFLTQEKVTEVDFQGGAVSARDTILSGVGVRVFLNKRKAFASASGLEQENVRTAINEAIAIAEALHLSDEKFKQLPDPRSPSKEGIIDYEILSISAETLSKEALSMVEQCKNLDNRIISVDGNRTANATAFAIVNSRGLAASTRITYSLGVVSAIAKEGNKQKTGFKFDISRTNKLNLQDAGLLAAKDALDMLRAKSFNSSEQIPVLWDPLAGGQYFGTAFGPGITGKFVVEGKSYFADKLGEAIGTQELKVSDDGTLPEALSSASVDGEGVPMQNTQIIDNGVLKSFLTDTYYAYQLDSQSTGNARRSGNPDYENPPSVGANTIVVGPGTKTKGELITQIKKGIIIKNFVMGMMHTNPVTGNFSIVCPSTYLIENGEIKHPLEPVNVAGNLFESLKNIEALGNDTFLSPFNIKNPSVIINGLTVTG